MGLSRTVFEINGDFSRKSPVSYPGVFNATWKWATTLEVKKLE